MQVAKLSDLKTMDSRRMLSKRRIFFFGRVTVQIKKKNTFSRNVSVKIGLENEEKSKENHSLPKKKTGNSVYNYNTELT